jgi:hypothetical protein
MFASQETPLVSREIRARTRLHARDVFLLMREAF